jgi:ketosteroid isomerase-like protein
MERVTDSPKEDGLDQPPSTAARNTERQRPGGMTLRELIEDVVIRFAWAYDAGDIPAAAAVFAEDATLEVSVPDVPPAHGREAIAAFVGQARAGRATRGEQPRHLVNNVRIVGHDRGTVDAVSYMTLVLTRADGTSLVDCAGTYTDRFVEIDGVGRSPPG